MAVSDVRKNKKMSVKNKKYKIPIHTPNSQSNTFNVVAVFRRNVYIFQGTAKTSF